MKNEVKKLIAKMFAFISPVSTNNNTAESLRVKISSTCVKLNVDSLLTNDAITEQAKAIQKIFIKSNKE